MDNYKEIREGLELPVLVKIPRTRDAVKWAAATGDYYEIHYDRDFAVSMGLPGVIIHGGLVCSWLGQVVEDWAGDRGRIVKQGCRYKGYVFPNEELLCSGQISRVYEEDSRTMVECNLKAETLSGAVPVIGFALIEFRSG